MYIGYEYAYNTSLHWWAFFLNDSFSISIRFLSESVIVFELDLCLYIYGRYITYLLQTYYIVLYQELLAFWTAVRCVLYCCFSLFVLQHGNCAWVVHLHNFIYIYIFYIYIYKHNLYIYIYTRVALGACMHYTERIARINFQELGAF